MTLPNGFDLATDGAFRLVAGFSEAPKAGRVIQLEANGQYSIELDVADGGDVLAWPLNGFEYAANDVVYVLFAANAPESGIIVGSVAPAPDLPGSIVDDHGNIPGLTDDDHTQYARLAGRSGGQTLQGGTASGNDLTLESTSHATKGNLLLNPNGGEVGIGRTPSAGVNLDVSGPLAARAELLFAGNISTPSRSVFIYRPATDEMVLGTNSADRVHIGSSGRVAIGGSAATASAALDIQGTDGALLLPRLTTTQRNALTASNGMVIYNTTTDKVQARASGSWVDLH